MERINDKFLLNQKITELLSGCFKNYLNGKSFDISALSGECVKYLKNKYSINGDIVKLDEQTLSIADKSFAEISLCEFIRNYCETDEDDLDDIILPKLYKQLDRAFALAVVRLVDNGGVNFYEQKNINNVINIDIYNKIKVDNYAVTQLVETIKEMLLAKNAKGAVISGSSSAGKTVAVAQAVKSLEALGKTVIWFDLANVNASVYNIACSLLKADKLSKTYIVFDNAQAKPAEISEFLRATQIISKKLNLQFCVILLCWPKSQNLIKSIAEEEIGSKVNCLVCNSKTQIIEIVRDSGYNQFEDAILFDSRGDVLVSSCILQYLEKNNGVYPTSSQLFENIYADCTKQKVLSEECDKCLYCISALGEFEIHVKSRYMRKHAEALKELCSCGIIRFYYDETAEGREEFVYLGHRSMANKIANYLRGKYFGANWLSPPEAIAVEYLMLNGQSQIHSMLERLDTEVQNSNNLFANLWKAFSKVRDYLYTKVSHDVVWGFNMASMIFSAEALKKINEFDDRAEKYWQKQAQAIRERWQPKADNSDIEYIGKEKIIVNGKSYDMTSEIVDFTENICSTMREEEKVLIYPPSQLSQNIDFYKFHNAWLLGLLLGFEGSADDEISEINAKRYVECAKNMQLSSGAFYPERVSWVTARVILGLAACGFTYDNCSVVKRACNWIVEQFTHRINTENIKFECGGWISGTGTWNSDIQITLMNLEALNKAGYQISGNSEIHKTVKYIGAHAKELADTLPNPLDIVWIVDVLASERKNLVSFNGIINKLSSETLRIWENADKTSFDKDTESSDVSFMAKELLNIMWYIVKANIGQLLEGLEREEYVRHEGKQIFISYRRTEGGGRLFADEIYDYLERIYRNNVFYDIKDLECESTDFNDVLENAIKKSKIVIAIVTDNAFKRCIKTDYKEEKDVFVNEIKTAQKNGTNIIVVYNNKIELPDELKANEKIYKLAEKLSKKNAVIFNSNDINASEKMCQSILEKIKKILIN